MGDQATALIDDIGIPALPDVQPGAYVPDQLQIDLGDGDPGLPALTRHRQRHVRLGFLAEIDRAEPDALRLRPGKGGALREIRGAADDVHLQPRDLELLLAFAVELGQLGDRRLLAQQAKIILATLVERARGPLRMRRPADLPLDLADELLDTQRRRLGLLLLDANQRRL